MKRLAILAVVVTTLGLAMSAVVDALDREGWIPHRQVTRLMVPTEQPWVTGEFLDCVAEPHPGLTNRYYGSNWTAAVDWIDSLTCGRDWKNDYITEQDLRVTYWGRIRIPYPESERLYWRIVAASTKDSSYPYNRPFRWRCRRNESSVTCWAVN